MSFFSTSDIMKYILSGDLLKHIVTSNEFVVTLKDTLEGDHAYELTRLIFAHPGARKEIRKIVLDILTEMGTKDEVDNDSISVSSCGTGRSSPQTSDDIE